MLFLFLWFFFKLREFCTVAAGAGAECLFREKTKPTTSRVQPGGGLGLGKYSYCHLSTTSGKASHCHTHLPSSLLFLVREGDDNVRAGLEKNEYGCWEMKEEGGGPSKFPFLPPASPKPHDPGGRVNSACLLLINPWPVLYGVVYRAVLGSQEHFREQSFTPEKRNKEGLSLTLENVQLNSLDLFLIVLTYSQPELLTRTKSNPSVFCVLFLLLLWLCLQSELGPWRFSSSYDPIR